MALCVGDVVRSVNGRDKDAVFFVIAVDGEFAVIADGMRRRLDHPKRKKIKHLQFISPGHSAAAEKLRSSEKVTNKELKRALTAAGGDSPEEQGVCNYGER